MTVPGTPIRWTTFSSSDNPQQFRRVLFSAWSQAEGLRGQPDALMVSRHLAQSDPTLETDLATIGVGLHIAGPREKSLPASLRSAQDKARWISSSSRSEASPVDQVITSFSGDALTDHNWRSRDRRRDLGDRELEERIEAWLALPAREPDPSCATEQVWKPGPWLTSWESSIPPDRERYFSHSGIERRTWLLTGQEPRDEMEDEEENFGGGYDNAPEIASNVVACWPNPPKEIAQSLGTTVKALQWFLDDKASLDRSRRFALLDMLGIDFDERLGCYAASGPCVLVANKPGPLEDIYTDMTGGGDAWPCELVPAKGQANPSWRYVLINPHSRPPSILMVARGDKIADRLGDLLLNFDGIRRVDPVLYRDVASTCARHASLPGQMGPRSGIFPIVTRTYGPTACGCRVKIRTTAKHSRGRAAQPTKSRSELNQSHRVLDQSPPRNHLQPAD